MKQYRGVEDSIAKKLTGNGYGLTAIDEKNSESRTDIRENYEGGKWTEIRRRQRALQTELHIRIKYKKAVR